MNTSDQIEISYTWDKETYLLASKLAYDYELKNSNRKYTGWIFIALTQFGVVSAIQKGTIGLLLVSTILVIYWYALRWPMRQRIIEKAFDKLPNADQQYTIKTSPSGININDLTLGWSDISSVLVLPKGIFLYFRSDQIFIPNKAFTDIEERNTLLKILKINVAQYTKNS